MSKYEEEEPTIKEIIFEMLRPGLQYIIFTIDNRFTRTCCLHLYQYEFLHGLKHQNTKKTSVG